MTVKTVRTPVSEDEFHELVFSYVALYGLPALADFLGVSHPTVQRWLDKTNSPAPNMRAAAAVWLRGALRP